MRKNLLVVKTLGLVCFLSLSAFAEAPQQDPAAAAAWQQQQAAQQQGFAQPGQPVQAAPQPQAAYPQAGQPQAYPQPGMPQAGYPQAGQPLPGQPMPGQPQPGFAQPTIPSQVPVVVPQAAAPKALRDLVILPAVDTTSLNLATPLQNALGHLLKESQLFKLRYNNSVLSSYSESEVGKMHSTLQSELFSFVYLEKDRLAVFLFDRNRPQHFIVATEPIGTAVGVQTLSQQHIETELISAVNQMTQNFKNSIYQPLPGIDPDNLVVSKGEKEELERRAKESRSLFAELAQITDRSMYIAASIGMARYATESKAASNVDFAVNLGVRLSDMIRFEIGADMFSYALLGAAVSFRIPFAEKYVFMSASLGGSYVLAQTTANNSDDSIIGAGDMLFGPGLSFNIPLLGANIRADLRYYLGPGAVFVGTYGLSYSL